MVNCTIFEEKPTIFQFLNDVRPPGRYFLIILGCFTAATLGIFCEEMYRLYRIQDPTGGLVKRSKIATILFLFPVVSVTSLSALFLPRAIFINSLVGALYLSVCIYKFVGVMVDMMGGREACAEMLTHDRLSMQTPPCCCCCCFLPEISITKKTLKRVMYLVTQLIIVHPILTYLKTIIIGELESPEAWPLMCIAALSMISSGIAIYGLAVILRMSKPHLSKHGIIGKYICIQLLIIFINLQGPIIKLIQKTGSLPCSMDGFLAGQYRHSNLQNSILVVETFFLAIIARLSYFVPIRKPDKEMSVISVDDIVYQHLEEPQKENGTSSNVESTKKEFSL